MRFYINRHSPIPFPLEKRAIPINNGNKYKNYAADCKFNTLISFEP